MVLSETIDDNKSTPIEQELRELKDEIINNTETHKIKDPEKHNSVAKEIISHLQNSKHFHSQYKNGLFSDFDLSSDAINTFMKQGLKDENYKIIYRAARLKKDLGREISLEEALDCASKNQRISDIFLEWYDSNNIDIKNISTIIFQVIDEWWDPFGGIIIPGTTRFTNESIFWKVKKEDNKRILYITDLNSDQQNELLKWMERRYAERFEDSISKYLEKNQKVNINTLYNIPDLFELYVQYYNIQHPQDNKIDAKNLKPEKRKEINEHFKAELKSIGYDVSDVDETLLKEIEERNKRIRKENRRTIEMIKQRNKERNERIQSREKPDIKPNLESPQAQSIDPNNATWAEIASDAKLWEELDNYELDIEKSEQKSEWAKEAIFRKAYKEFIGSHNDIKEIITQEWMRRIFNIDSNNIDKSEWEDFRAHNPLLKNISPDEVEKIYNTLSSFSNAYKKSEEELNDKSSDMKVQINKTVKTHAIGAVIDNVRDIFGSLTEWQDWNSELQNWRIEWFKLANDKPVQKIWDNIIISGSFNGSDIKVRYELGSGKLFMNSFLQKLGVNKISIWNEFLINYQIWTIKPFNNVLNDYYKLPPRTPKKNSTHWIPPKKPPREDFTEPYKPTNDIIKDSWPKWKPMRMPSWVPWIQSKINKDEINSRKEEAKKILNSQIDLIGEAIKKETESQAQKNSAINDFIKTFNLDSNWEYESLDFNYWSNLFDVIQILNESDSSSLEYFNNTFMPKVMKYSWLEWGRYNESQNKNNGKSEKIFEYKGDNENINYMKDKIKDFNSKQFVWIANFESQHQLWFADLIKEKLTTWTQPNWKLDIWKMQNFIKNLQAIDKDNS